MIVTGEADAFVQGVAPAEETRIEFDFGLTVDAATASRVDGGGRLATTIALNRTVGRVHGADDPARARARRLDAGRLRAALRRRSASFAFDARPAAARRRADRRRRSTLGSSRDGAPTGRDRS